MKEGNPDLAGNTGHVVFGSSNNGTTNSNSVRAQMYARVFFISSLEELISCSRQKVKISAKTLHVLPRIRVWATGGLTVILRIPPMYALLFTAMTKPVQLLMRCRGAHTRTYRQAAFQDNFFVFRDIENA
jgi:hypothetical protein